MERFIKFAITHNYVSSFSAPNLNSYSVIAPDDNMLLDINLSAAFSHVGTADVYVKYDLIVNGEILATATRPIFAQRASGAPMTENEALAQRLGRLLKLCSQRVIAQEQLAQQNKMLKGIRTDFKTRGC